MIACSPCGKPIRSMSDALRHTACVKPDSGLTHEWRAEQVIDIGGWLDPGWYVFGGQADEDGHPEYVLHVRNGDPETAAEQIAAALRGEE